jgi:hypothetical protein
MITYFVQAVDGAGNVAVALDNGLPYIALAADFQLYLPLIRR